MFVHEHRITSNSDSPTTKNTVAFIYRSPQKIVNIPLLKSSRSEERPISPARYKYLVSICTRGLAIALAVSRRLLTAKARVCAQVSPCWICGAQSGTGTRFSPSPLGFTVSIAPSMLHIHSRIIWGWTVGPLEAQSHGDIVSPHRNNKNHYAKWKHSSSLSPILLLLEAHTSSPSC
jgi:hypothetical protein